MDKATYLKIEVHLLDSLIGACEAVDACLDAHEIDQANQLVTLRDHIAGYISQYRRDNPDLSRVADPEPPCIDCGRPRLEHHMGHQYVERASERVGLVR